MNRFLQEDPKHAASPRKTLRGVAGTVKMTHAQGEIRDVNICSVPGSVYMSVEQQSRHYARAELHPLCCEST